MEKSIYISEIDQRVLFTGLKPSRIEFEPQTLEYEGDKEGVEFSEVVWDESLYTPTENKFIRDIMPRIESELAEAYMEEMKTY